MEIRGILSLALKLLARGVVVGALGQVVVQGHLWDSVRPACRCYGRTVAKVSYLSKMHRNPLDRSKAQQVVTVYQSHQESLVQAGLAWWYQRYAPNDTQLAELEREARQAKRGLWADVHPVPPWDWRRGKRAAAKTPSGPGRVARQERPPAGSGGLRCNVKSKVFHQSGCRHYRCKKCTATFGSEAEAVAAGYRLHGGR
jgi:hypothetical protein